MSDDMRIATEDILLAGYQAVARRGGKISYDLAKKLGAEDKVVTERSKTAKAIAEEQQNPKLPENAGGLVGDPLAESDAQTGPQPKSKK